MNAAQQRLAEREQDHAHIAALEHINAVLITGIIEVAQDCRECAAGIATPDEKRVFISIDRRLGAVLLLAKGQA